jgi:hypothetical protein
MKESAKQSQNEVIKMYVVGKKTTRIESSTKQKISWITALWEINV